MTQRETKTLPAKGAAATGLSRAEVETRRATHGWNELPQPPTTPPITVFIRQFTNFLVVILILAAVIAFFVGDPVDTLAIGLVIMLNGVLGFVQEWRAETALIALRKMLSTHTTVVRDGQEVTIDPRELVPDDLILLATGNRVPADARLTHALQLKCDESVLTGESLPVEKSTDPSEGHDLFAGTTIVSGRAEAIVTAIGAATEFGKIATRPSTAQRAKTGLQTQLERLARQLVIFMTALSLAVAMVPEGLPAVVTITLALGAAAMARRNALARRLQAVETLGAASVICTDKTGTLTENMMTATRVWTPDRSYEVTGSGYDPTGHIAYQGQRLRASDDPGLARLLTAVLTCSHARLSRQGDSWSMTGEPTEGALVTLAYKGWCTALDSTDVLHELPFTSERKRMSVLARTDAGHMVFTKGAPEQVLDVCDQVQEGANARKLGDRDVALISESYHQMAEDGLRVIAVAARPTTSEDCREAGLIFLGLVGLIDPPRAEVKSAIASTRSAGIRVIMITGDGPVTARAIARAVGLPVAQTMTGDELDALTPEALSRALTTDILFARTHPIHKLKIVQALQAQGQVVAMTGDGVNDAPALKTADIGVAMGVRGTEVAKDASDLVLLDDNFATIVNAIEEGRRQFANIRKFVRYLLASNAGEVVALVVNILIGGPLIFLATQILWMNLVTDGVTAVALGLEKTEPDQMDHRPRQKSTPILGKTGVAVILGFGLYTGLASLFVFTHFLAVDVTQARTAAFTAMVFFEKFSVFAFRSLHHPCWRIGWLSNPLLIGALTITLGAQIAAVYWPPLQTLLHTGPLQTDHWVMILALTAPILLVPEIFKSLARRRYAKA